MKVLAADDDAVTRRLLESYLQRWGYEVVMVSDGAEAWQRFEQDDFPLVLSDWQMPGLDGVELIRRIRASERGKLCYAILVTGKSQKEDLVEGMEAGADDFVTKPFDRDELRVRLREGERIVNLERALHEQNRLLQENVQARQKLDILTQSVVGDFDQLAQTLGQVREQLGTLRDELIGDDDQPRAISPPVVLRLADDLKSTLAQIATDIDMTRQAVETLRAISAGRGS